MDRVQVLLSAYNGERYIKEQIDSILAQERIELSLLVRDDGSKDHTTEILSEYPRGNLKYIKGENVGVTKSFFELLHSAGEADYYAFSDQDDVWDKDKLISAIEMLSTYTEIPAVYSSNTRLVDKNLQFLKKEDKRPRTTLGSALIKNYATGCTVVFNRELMKRLKLATDVTAPYHDWWVNLVALSVGGVSVYDHAPHINYRQHGNNVVGGSESTWTKWKNRLNRYRKQSYSRNEMAKKLLEYYGHEIQDDNREILRNISKYKKNKIKIILNKQIKTGKPVDDFLFGVCLISNKI